MSRLLFIVYCVGAATALYAPPNDVADAATDPVPWTSSALEDLLSGKAELLPFLLDNVHPSELLVPLKHPDMPKPRNYSEFDHAPGSQVFLEAIIAAEPPPNPQVLVVSPVGIGCDLCVLLLFWIAIMLCCSRRHQPTMIVDTSAQTAESLKV